MKKSPLRKKRATPRRQAAVTCASRGCKRPPRTESLCRTHATARADKLMGDFVKARDGGCVARGKHAGPIQWAHIVSRRYRAVRWDPNNAVALCAGHHMYFTPRPLEWDTWVTAHIGAEAYADLRRRALDDAPTDPGDVIRTYGAKR